MCEINPKRKQIFRLEFFTSATISDEEWQKLVIERILVLEQEFNASGKVRVHVHEVDQIDPMPLWMLDYIAGGGE